jgi:hypothetical protein
MSFLGVLEVTLQCFPPNSEQDFHGGNGIEGKGREGKEREDERSLFLAAALGNRASPPQILNSLFKLMIAINRFALLSFLFQWN